MIDVFNKNLMNNYYNIISNYKAEYDILQLFTQ